MKESVKISLAHYELLKNRTGTNFIELAELRAMRARLGISMDFVAKHTGVNKATISRIELERNCSYQNVKKLYEFYQSQNQSKNES